MIQKSLKKTILPLALLILIQIGFLIPSQNVFGQTKQLNLQNIQRISRSIYLIQHEYFDPIRVKPRKMLKEGFFELAKEVPEVLPLFQGNHLKFQLGAKSLDVKLDKVKVLYDALLPISLVFDFLNTNYKGDAKFEDMEYAFIAGMLSTLDPHSNILTPEIYKEFKTQTQGEYGGLGIVISIKDKELTVFAPFEGTPADRAGLLADDKIQQIQDQSTTNMPLDEAVELMRGPPGTKVTLKIKSKNRDPRNVDLIREVINVTSVQSKLFSQNNKNFGIIRIKGFQDNTYKDVITELKTLNQQSNNSLNGIILDLRNNAGGLLDQSILTADLFLSGGDIVLTVGANNTTEERASAKNQKTDITLPMIVLINEGAASASEIVAGALKNNNRAIVMGQKSFGKGSVQSLFSLRDGSSLKLTVAQYLTPGRESIQAVGITPDIHLYSSVIADDYYDLHEDVNYSEEKLDAHLDNTKLTKKSVPLYTLTYLKDVKSSDESINSYTSKIEESDFPLKLAVQILDQVAAPNKKTMLSHVGSLLNSEAIKQDKRITEALQKKKIDWTIGQATKQPNISIRHEFFNSAKQKIKAIKAGSTITMRVTVKNNGSTSLNRVITDIEALNPLLNHKEFVFGKLGPGTEKSAEIKVKIPSEIINFTEDIKLVTYTEKTLNKPHSTYAHTHFVEKQQPQFTYTYQVLDGNAPDTTGNKNGIPEKGEDVVLKVSVKNLGPGLSEKTIVNIKNTEGKYVFLKKARDTMGSLKPAQTASSDLRFNIKENFSKDKFAIDVFAIDDDTKAGISDTLTFNLNKAIPSDPKPNTFQTAPKIMISDKTKQVGDKLMLTASVEDQTSLKDIAVFSKGKKIIYINTEKEKNTKKKDISIEIPLEDGINSVVIQARGTRDLLSQKSISVVYNKEMHLAGTTAK